jgi:transketolase
LAIHGGIIPFTGTFLIFYDYMRPPVRLAAIMGAHVIFIFTHDSIGLGQDGPTHQPVEQLLGLRGVPRLITMRPADATETVEAWKFAMAHKGPVAMVLSRQNLPVLNRTELAPAAGLQKGGYVLWQANNKPEIILISTGSEVHISLEAGKKLQELGISARVVSLPSWEIFDMQEEGYRNSVLPAQLKMRISIEAATPLGWEHYVGLEGISIGLHRFGASASGKIVMEKLGFTSENIVSQALKLLKKNLI